MYYISLDHKVVALNFRKQDSINEWKDSYQRTLNYNVTMFFQHPVDQLICKLTAQFNLLPSCFIEKLGCSSQFEAKENNLSFSF